MKNILELCDSEVDLVALTLALGAENVGGLSDEEGALADKASHRLIDKAKLDKIRTLIKGNNDPLGEIFSLIRSSEVRRERGATYTPMPIVKTMVDWAVANKKPTRIVDPGVGSGRFLTQAGLAFPSANLVGIDVDPLAALMARANLSVLGLGKRSKIILGDYRNFSEQIDGSTLYIGNPPYVRHHQIPQDWKDWLASEAAKLGFSASKLAGLHVYFFLATVCQAQKDDYGTFITAAEWLDVNYGALVRKLMLAELGGKSITVVDPKAQPFPDAATTAAITTFEIGSESNSLIFQRIESLDTLQGLVDGREINRERLASESRWSHLIHAPVKAPEGYVELGELCRVHRGTVTGANGVWIAGEHSIGLPESVLFPTITKAREVLEARGVLADAARLRCVIDLPIDLDELDTVERKAVLKFLKTARAMGGDKGYVASHRKAWWSVGLRAAAPIISTYMARRPPGFIINQADARHINIAHGLYPRVCLTEQAKTNLVSYLHGNISQNSGRTYAGGLTKFEPREMERLIVPGPELLLAGGAR
ncbi:Eco57I restriction-modification methylase domain-containing protein [Pseudomonas shirazensis]|uniref:Eco57I restriction-modification methylase domain-containing protein n=1 Tax=Pseudomonas shirazensis TaxID=2745494 RepID=UPI003D01903D